MAKGQELMSQKEKDYVSFCHSRNVKAQRTDVDYEAVFNGQKIEYNLLDGKRDDVKRIFGKQDKRSRKWLRPSANTSAEFLEQKMMVCELLEITSIIKFVSTDGDSVNKIEDSALSYFEGCFGAIINAPKTFWFLEEFFGVCSENARKRMMDVLFGRCHEIKESGALFGFLDRNMDTVPASSSFISSNLWRCSSGYILGLFLILKDETLVNPVFQSFMESAICECKGLERFVPVLVSLCSKRDRSQLKSKLLSSNIRDVDELTRI